MIRNCRLGHAQSLCNPVLGYAEAVHADVPHRFLLLPSSHSPRLVIKPPPTSSRRLPMEIPFSIYDRYSFRASPILSPSQVILFTNVSHSVPLHDTVDFPSSGLSWLVCGESGSLCTLCTYVPHSYHSVNGIFKSFLIPGFKLSYLPLGQLAEMASVIKYTALTALCAPHCRNYRKYQF